jgi:WD40 repeat protein
VSTDGGLLVVATDGRLFAGWSTTNATTDALARFTYQSPDAFHDNSPKPLALSPDGKLLALATADRFLTVFKTDDRNASGQRLALEGLPNSVDFTPSGQHVIVTTGRGQAWLIQLRPWQVVAVGNHSLLLHEAQFDEPAGLMVGSSEGATITWRLTPPPPPDFLATNLPDIRQVVAIPNPPSTANAGQPASEFLAWVAPSDLLRIRTGGRSLRVEPVTAVPSAACLAIAAGPPATAFLGDTNGKLLRLSLSSPPAVEEVLRVSSRIYHCAVSPDGRRVMLGESTNLHFFALNGGRSLELTNHALPMEFYNSVVSPDGQKAAIAFFQETFVVFDLRDGRMLWSNEQDFGFQSRDLVFSPDSRRLAGSSMSGAIRVWDAASGQEIMPAFSKARYLEYPKSVAWDGEARYLLASGQRSAVLLDAGSGAYSWPIAPIGGRNRGLLRPDAQYAVFASQGGEIAYWAVSPVTPPIRLGVWKPDRLDYAFALWAGDYQHVLTYHPSGQVRYLSLPVEPASPGLLRDLAEWATARTVNSAGVTRDLDTAARDEQLARLRAAAASGELAPAYARHLPPAL